MHWHCLAVVSDDELSDPVPVDEPAPPSPPTPPVVPHRHRRFPGSQGTTHADPCSTQSLSFTGRAGMATGILRQHPGTLGALSDCCPSCDLRALLLLLLPFST